jgi:hypothetical protein
MAPRVTPTSSPVEKKGDMARGERECSEHKKKMSDKIFFVAFVFWNAIE